ncbi:serine protease [Halobacteriales archaeon QS_4_62_28]|nr:MAG: serine protease [Halobacteriales archaeon QS_4_62_28]
MDNRLSRRAMLGTLATAVGGAAGCQAPVGNPIQADPDDGSSQATESTGSANQINENSPYGAVYDDVADSVAAVQVYTSNGRGGQGSAFVYSDDYLVTNQHVVGRAEKVYVQYRDSGWIEAPVVETDVYSDLAVLEVNRKPDSASTLPFVEEEPGIGTEVVAIGNPFGLSGSVSAGIISGVDRTLPAANGFSIPDAVQTDSAANPGNSGGPLVDLDGRIVGVINSGGGDNIAFGISAALTKRVVPALIEEGDYQHSYMGVRLTDVTPQIIQANDLPVSRGVYIDEVISGGPSDGVLQGSMGEREINGVTAPVDGDVVVRMNDTSTPTRQELSTFLALETSPGDTIDVRVIRDGERQTVELELGNRPPVEQ